MGKWPWCCTTTSLDNSTELRAEKNCPVVSEICVPHSLYPTGTRSNKFLPPWATMALHNYRYRQIHRTFKSENPSCGFKDMCSAKCESCWYQICAHGHNKIMSDATFWVQTEYKHNVKDLYIHAWINHAWYIRNMPSNITKHNFLSLLWTIKYEPTVGNLIWASLFSDNTLSSSFLSIVLGSGSQGELLPLQSALFNPSVCSSFNSPWPNCEGYQCAGEKQLAGLLMQISVWMEIGLEDGFIPYNQ